MNKKTKRLPYLLGSLGLIGVAIVITTLIDTTRGLNPPTGEIRTKATSSIALQLTGTVTSIDYQKRTIGVENLKFLHEKSPSMGTWTLQPPGNYNLGLLQTGSDILISVAASSFIANPKHLMTVGEIRIFK